MRQLGGDVPVALGMPIGYCESRLAEGLRLAELLGDQAAAADLLARLAIVATNRLQFDRALDYGQRAVAAGRAACDDQALAAGLDGLKTAHAYLGHTGALATVLDELDPLLRRQGDPFRLQHAVFESAFVPLAAGDWTQATAAMESAIEINRRSGYPHSAAKYVAYLGRLARLLGRDDAAVGKAQVQRARLAGVEVAVVVARDAIVDEAETAEELCPRYRRRRCVLGDGQQHLLAESGDLRAEESGRRLLALGHLCVAVDERGGEGGEPSMTTPCRRGELECAGRCVDPDLDRSREGDRPGAA